MANLSTGQQATTSIQKSWTRCQDRYGLDPRSSSAFADASRNPTQQSQELLPISTGELDRLTQVVGSAGHSIILTDANGTILKSYSHRDYRSDFDRAGLIPGQCWGEAFRGTNGIGTAIAERKATLVHGDQHYVTANQNLSCAASPIFDEQQNLMAVLDTSTVNPERDPTRALHTLAMVSECARRIERSWFEYRFADCWLFTVQANNRSTVTFAVSESRKIVGLEACAYRFLPECTGWVGRLLDDVLDAPTLESLSNTAGSDLQFHVPVFSQGHYLGFGHLSAPQPAEMTASPNLSSTEVVAHDPVGELDCLNHGDPAMAACIKQARRLVDRNIPVLISGETGVGKDRFAKAMHQSSVRADGPFVAVNCAAIPKDLIEAELFGYVKGAFTGAHADGRVGLFGQADGGTLFLDEIGDMPSDVQTKLLRAVEERRITPIGSDQAIDVDICLISASHVDLDLAVKQGQFRQDLLYRIRGLELRLPSLRLRTDKLPLLKAIAQEAMQSVGVQVQVSQAAWHSLCDHQWPGNCREAVQVISTTFALADEGDVIGPEDWVGIDSKPTSVANETASVRAARCEQALAETDGNASQAAQRLGVSRATFYRWRDNAN